MEPATIDHKTPAALSKSAKGDKIQRVTGKVRTAIEAMVWECLPRDKAALKAGISEHGLYKALRKAPVKAFYLSELEVLRTSERARDIHTLNEVRDQTTNQMARVQAVKAKWQIEDEQQASANTQQLPGLVVVVNTFPRVSADPPTIDVSQRVLTHD